MSRRIIGIGIVLLVLLSSAVLAEDPDRIISNSKDWRDVYSVMQYGALTKTQAHFLVSNKHATLLLNGIPDTNHLWSVSSQRVPQAVGYRTILESKGYSAEEFVYENANLELGKQLEGITNFIILDDSYGYNAVSVAPYAAVKKSYVLFADENNIDDIDEFLGEKQIDELIVYGNVDREVADTLAKYEPETINNNGDRFLNNIEIVKKFQEVQEAKQVILTNGEFIEQEIMSGNEPVVFIGSNNVPDVVREYISESPIEIGVLIGNELVGTATFIRRQVGISVFVKFAQGARAPQGSISQVEALDMFYMPTYQLNLEIESAKYNKATNKLEVTLRNTEEQAVYFKGTYSLLSQDGALIGVGDEDSVFLDGNEVKTMTYDVEPLPDGRITVDVFVIYGESPFSLEKEARLTLDVDSVQVLDECAIDLHSLSVNVRRKIFYIQVENPSTVDCYVDSELVDLIVASAEITVGQDEVELLESGKKKNLRIRVDDFEAEDLEDNELVTARVYYGQRENALVNIIEGNLELTEQRGDYVFYTLLVIIVILILLIIFKRRKKKTKVKVKHV